MGGEVVAVAGASCAGKTTLADLLAKEYGEGRNVVVLHQDDYYFDGVTDWETPSSIDFGRLVRDVDRLKDQHKLNNDSDSSSPSVIVEGFLLFSNAELWGRFDVVLFLEVGREECRRRRLLRDRFVAAHPKYFDDDIWPQYIANNQHILDRVSEERTEEQTPSPFFFSVGEPDHPVLVVPLSSSDPPETLLSASKDSISRLHLFTKS